MERKEIGDKANDSQVGGDHYKGKTVEHWDFVIMHSIPYLEAQIIKYVMRHRKKNGLQDLYKAMHFLDKLIETEELRNSLVQGQKAIRPHNVACPDCGYDVCRCKVGQA